MKEPFALQNAAIAPQDTAAMSRAKAHWDGIAKPLDGLGKLETALVRIAGLTGSEAIRLDRRTVLVLCADNGVVKEGVTQTDASVTAVMARRISEHRSSVCLMAKTARADVIPVDLGMLTRVEGVRDLHVGNGTANMA
ncbi:MAG: nicotinate-nucleotide--dimethylbenzimidazole phosphoribosyltransferase, partial [Clostridia bacterium]|nr:nicotinate-nucleotide--dimethylbenzimidazole phosphoribosyltransferase [Clostridia bacterium]